MKFTYAFILCGALSLPSLAVSDQAGKSYEKTKEIVSSAGDNCDSSTSVTDMHGSKLSSSTPKSGTPKSGDGCYKWKVRACSINEDAVRECCSWMLCNGNGNCCERHWLTECCGL